jgi:hypothetical protein
VHVAGGEKFSSARSNPLFPSGGLTLRAVAISATVIRNGGTIPTTGALIDMTAQCGRTTPRNGQQHFDVAPSYVQTAFAVTWVPVRTWTVSRLETGYQPLSIKNSSGVFFSKI